MKPTERSGTVQQPDLFDCRKITLCTKGNIRPTGEHLQGILSCECIYPRRFREGVVQIGVKFRVSKKWLNKFSAYKKMASITVGYLYMETMNILDAQMFIDGYQVKRVSDTSYGSLWEVSLTLKEF